MAISFEEVCQAIDSILDKQDKFTLQEVRQELGSRGSMSTISKFVQKWRSEHYMSHRPQSSHMQPAPDSIMEAVTSVWQNMSHQNSALVQEKEQLLKQQQDDYDKQLEQMNLALEQSEKDIELLKKELQNQHAQREILELDSQKQKQQSKILLEKNLLLEEQMKKVQHLSDSYQENIRSQLEQACNEIKKAHLKEKEGLQAQLSQLQELNEQQRVEYMKKIDALQSTLLTYESQKTQQDYSASLLKKIDLLHDNQQSLNSAQEELKNKTDTFISTQSKLRKSLEKEIFCAQIHSKWHSMF